MKQSKIRLSLDITPDAKVKLDELVALSRSNTYVEAFKKAMSLYEFVLLEEKKGSSFIIEGEKDGQKTREKILIV